MWAKNRAGSKRAEEPGNWGFCIPVLLWLISLAADRVVPQCHCFLSWLRALGNWSTYGFTATQKSSGGSPEPPGAPRSSTDLELTKEQCECKVYKNLHDSFGGVTDPGELGSTGRAVEAFKRLPSARCTSTLVPLLSSSVPSPHTLQFISALGSSVLFELQTSATELFLSPGSLSGDSASPTYRVYPPTTGLSRQCQPLAAKVRLCEGKRPKLSAKNRKGVIPLINRELLPFPSSRNPSKRVSDTVSGPCN